MRFDGASISTFTAFVSFVPLSIRILSSCEDLHRRDAECAERNTLCDLCGSAVNPLRLRLRRAVLFVVNPVFFTAPAALPTLRRQANAPARRAGRLRT
jgi:hypothetical protein